MELYFLEAAVPLTKTIGKNSKEPYPMVKFFSSIREQVKTPLEFYKAIKTHAEEGHCLLKGRLHKQLKNESRAGSTRTDDETEWLCLDFDRFPTDNIDNQLAAMGLGDVTYIIQYSSSHGLPENEGTVSAHVFIMLDRLVHAPLLKAWLMNQNMKCFQDAMRLSRDKNQISWPLDITTCQNDKLIYIAPPRFVGMKDPMEQPRIQLITKVHQRLKVSQLGERHIDALREDARKILNELRKAEGLKARTAGTSWVGDKEVANKPTVATVTGIKDAGEWVRLNLNGGDSWAYCHPKDNFELIYDFKSDSWYKTKELVPGYYQTLKEEQIERNAAPTEDGDVILGFRDRNTGSYWNGYWNPKEQHLQLFPAKNEKQIEHWYLAHNRVLFDYIPIWDLTYDPHEDWIVDEDNLRINLFQKSEFADVEPRENDDWPTIKSIVCHMLGTTPNSDVYEHFINWFACLFQRKHKPRTAWVAHGIEGTGKGFFANKIAAKLLGQKNVSLIMTNNLEDKFNTFMENKLFVFVDEVDVDDFKEKGLITAKLRNWITEPFVSVRRMRQAAIEVPNYAGFLFASNRPQPVFIPTTDRRYNVGNFQSEKLPRPNEETVNEEMLAFAEFLAAHAADILKADSIIETDERQLIKNLGMTSADEAAQAILKGDLGYLWMERADEKLIRETGIHNSVTETAQAYGLLMDRLIEEAKESPSNRITRDELLIIFTHLIGNGVPTSPNKFTSFLRHKGIVTERIRKNDVLTYGIKVEWKLEDWLLEEIGSKKKTQSIRRVK